MFLSALLITLTYFFIYFILGSPCLLGDGINQVIT
nr:MAG TPA: hypothetical protein [Caudoviricetes sp.]